MGWFSGCSCLVNRCIVLLCLLLLAACSEKQPDPLRIASSPWPGYEPLYLARDLGNLETAKVSLFELPSSDITMESFRNHSTDLATLTLDETMELLHDGVKLRVLLILDVSNGGDAVLARPEIKSLPDLKSKRVSIVNIPLGLYMLSRTLEAAGLNRNDVTVFPMAESRQEDFYRQGKVDAVITFEPVKSALIAAGAHVLFDSSQIPNEIFDLLVVHENVYRQRRDDICNVVQQWFITLDYMHEHHDDAAMRITQRLNMKPEEYDGLMSGILLPSRVENRRMLGGDSPGILGPAQNLSTIMLKEKMLTLPVDFRPALDPGFSSCFVK